MKFLIDTHIAIRAVSDNVFTDIYFGVYVSNREDRKDWVFRHVSGGERNYEGKYSCC